jgi:hypothetical protein
MGIGLGIILLGESLFYAVPSVQYYIVSPFGTKSTVFNAGLHFKIPFSRVQEWSKFIDIKCIDEEEINTPLSEGVEGIIKGGIPIRFIDQVTGNVKVSVRVELPSDEASFIKLAEEFKDQTNFVNNTLLATVQEQVSNTGYMYAAQDYISGAASDFRQTIDDQLKNGGYSVEKKEMFDTIYTAIQDTGKRRIKEVNTKYMVKRRKDSNGRDIRIPHDINKNKVGISQVIVSNIVLEEAFRKRLEKQRDIASQKRIEMEAVEAAKIAQQKIIAEGERDKAAERVTQEKEQVKTLIAIETQVKQEESKRELAEIALKTERLKAEAEKVKADAESYKNQKLVSAGLTPQERAKIEKETAIGVAAELAKLKLPEVYIGGSDGKGNEGIISSLLGAEMGRNMLNKGK